MTTGESHCHVEEVAAVFGRGEIVVVADDDDRENEGDLFIAASMCTPEKMAFIIRHTSGIVCAPLSAEEAKRLHLDPMVALNDAPLGTATRGAEVKRFAETHGIKHITIADLIAYRQVREKLVERIGEFTYPTEIGTLKGYAYVTPFDKVSHMALVYGRIGDGRDVPTRLHRANILRDIFGGAPEVHGALRRFAN